MNEIKVNPLEEIKINRETLKSKITIKNLSMEGKAYKIKTTRPKEYVVKPSIGIIIPMQEVDIEVELSRECVPDESHKFLIEVYEFDWKRSISNLKTELRNKNISPIHVHKLVSSFESKDPLDMTLGLEYKRNNYSKLLVAASYSFIIVVLFLLFVNIFSKNDF